MTTLHLHPNSFKLFLIYIILFVILLFYDLLLQIHLPCLICMYVYIMYIKKGFMWGGEKRKLQGNERDVRSVT